MGIEVNPKAILLAKLTEVEICDLANFNCDDKEMNRFLNEEAFEDQGCGLNTTMLLYYKGKLSCFCSICADSLKLTEEERKEIQDELYSTVPAVKIARLGRDVDFRGYEFGKRMIKYVILKALEIDEDLCGVRMITLDAYPHRVEYYKNLGFKVNMHQLYRSKNKNTVSMRYDIYNEAFK